MQNFLGKGLPPLQHPQIIYLNTFRQKEKKKKKKERKKERKGPEIWYF